jgi:hypothetical protein
MLFKYLIHILSSDPQGIPDQLEVDWDVYCQVNDENRKLYSILRGIEDTIFFYDDPQPYGMNPSREDITGNFCG